MLTRRDAGKVVVAAVASTALLGTGVQSAAAIESKVIKIGINLPLTDADAQHANRIKFGALLGILQANGTGVVPSYKFAPWVVNGATSTAGPYDPAQAATSPQVRR